MPVNQWELQSHFMDANMFNATLGHVLYDMFTFLKMHQQ